MGQKVNPIGLRIGITEHWRSFWFANDRTFKDLLREDVETRKFLLQNCFPRGSVTKVEIEKVADKMRIILWSPRPGVVLGRKGSEINNVRELLFSRINKQVQIDVNEVQNPGQDAQFIADSIAMQLERRVPHRVAVKKAMALALNSGALGIKIRVGGRLGGAEISRSELYISGKVPLHTLRAKIDYAQSTSITKFGCIGVKVWIFLGEMFEDKNVAIQTSGEGEDAQQPVTEDAEATKMRRRKRNASDAQKGKVSKKSAR
jgi:small subunit ribosomal protein S3